MSTAALNYVSPEEYLRLERMAEYRSEYIDGRVIAMTGGSREHNFISGNLYRALRQRLRGRPCDTYITTMRVKVGTTYRYVYPDVVVACEPRFEDGHTDTLTNPVVIIEVLSPSTQSYDRGEKLAQYRGIPSVEECIIVSQEQVRVEQYARAGDVWSCTVYDRMDATLDIPSLGCAIPIAEIYEDVDLGSGA